LERGEQGQQRITNGHALPIQFRPGKPNGIIETVAQQYQRPTKLELPAAALQSCLR